MRTVLLDEVSEINPRPPAIAADETVSFVGMAQLDASTARTDVGQAVSFSQVSKGYTVFADGDLLLAKITPCFENNKIGQAQLGHKIGVGSTEFHVLRPGDRINDRYLLHFLRQNIVRRRGEMRMTGSAGQRRVPVAFLQNLEIPLPPLDEQRRIAAILDQTDAVRSKQQMADDYSDQLSRAVYLDMFGDPVANYRGWSQVRVQDVCTLVRGSSPRPQGDPRYFGGPVPRLMISDITRDGKWVTPRTDSLTLEGAKRSRPCKKGTVVMAVSGNIGLVSQLAIDACIHDGFVGFTELKSDVLRPKFLLDTLDVSKRVHETSTAGAIFKNITTADIKALELIAPPLHLQDDYGRRTAAMETLRMSRRAQALAFEQLWASLQDRAFSGRL